MKVVVDTSILIDLDRGKEPAKSVAKALTEKDIELYLSTVSISELFVGVNLQEEPSRHINGARELLAQFSWIPLTAAIAEKTGEFIAKRKDKGAPVEYQDNAIAATFVSVKADYLLTDNRKHFLGLGFDDKVIGPPDFLKKL